MSYQYLFGNRKYGPRKRVRRGGPVFGKKVEVPVLRGWGLPVEFVVDKYHRLLRG